MSDWSNLPELKKTEDLYRPFVLSGRRCYLIGSQNGFFPDIGWHTHQEMGGVWLALATKQSDRLVGMALLSPEGDRRGAAMTTMEIFLHKNFHGHVPQLISAALAAAKERAWGRIECRLPSIDEAKIASLAGAGFTEVAREENAASVNETICDLVRLRMAVG